MILLSFLPDSSPVPCPANHRERDTGKFPGLCPPWRPPGRSHLDRDPDPSVPDDGWDGGDILVFLTGPKVCCSELPCDTTSGKS